MSEYTDSQVDVLLDMYFRDSPRNAPWPAIATAMGVECNQNALERLLWGVVTGYGGKDPEGPRLEYVPTPARDVRTGRVWYSRETKCLGKALRGAGQQRNPPVDIRYIAAVLARTREEVSEKWEEMKNPTGMPGFGVVR